MRGIGRAALDVLLAEPQTDPDRVAAVGHGTGGAIALELGRAAVAQDFGVRPTAISRLERGLSRDDDLTHAHRDWLQAA